MASVSSVSVAPRFFESSHDGLSSARESSNHLDELHYWNKSHGRLGHLDNIIEYKDLYIEYIRTLPRLLSGYDTYPAMCIYL